MYFYYFSSKTAQIARLVDLRDNKMVSASECCCSQMAEGVEFLLKRYPDYVTVDDLPMDTVQERVILSLAASQHCVTDLLLCHDC